MSRYQICVCGLISKFETLNLSAKTEGTRDVVLAANTPNKISVRLLDSETAHIRAIRKATSHWADVGNVSVARHARKTKLRIYIEAF